MMRKEWQKPEMEVLDVKQTMADDERKRQECDPS